MALLQTLLATVVTLGILVTIHEYGHFWVARRCGVRVLRFSVGFGKPLWRRVGRTGTEYVVAAIPLGGYVRMLDEREGEVPPHLLDQAFNRKSVYQRIAIVAAGPLVNLAFAVLAYWLLFVSGTNTVVPVIGDVRPGTLAEQAGLRIGEEIVQVDGARTPSWDEINLRLAARLGESGELRIQTRALDDGSVYRHAVALGEWQVDEQRGPLWSLGVTPYQPPVPPLIGRVLPDGRAAAAGLQPGDRIERVDGEPVTDWFALVELVQASPEQPLAVELARDGRLVHLTLTPERRATEEGGSEGYLGVGAAPYEWPAELQRDLTLSPLAAVPAAFAKTGQMVVLIMESLGKMIQGAISVKHLSGPITIAKVAGASAASGLESFLNFLAYLSISLGILNLLPIPMLDGGHLLYYLVEVVRGKPVSERVQLIGLKLGMSLLLLLMLMALYNDLSRL